MEKCTDFDKATFILTIDASRGFWRITIDDADKDKLALVSYQGLYQLVGWKPSGLNNTPETFWNHIRRDIILSQFAARSYILDSIDVFSKMQNNYTELVQKVLLFLYRARFTLNSKFVRFPITQ